LNEPQSPSFKKKKFSTKLGSINVRDSPRHRHANTHIHHHNGEDEEEIVLTEVA